MPRNSFEEGYGDELDRMRARRRQKRGWEPAEPFYDEDDDLQGSYLEDDEVDGAYDLEEEEMWEDLSPGMERRTPFGRKGGGHPTHSGSGKGEGRRAGGKGGARRTSGDGEAHKRGGRDKNEPPMQQKKLKKRRRGLKLFLLLLLLIAAFLYGKRWLKDRDGYWNIAVFGVDARDGNLGKGALADVQMIASINKKTGEIRLVSVYRDTYVQINSEGDFHKINEAYFKGGYEQAVGTLERNLDLAIDDYATFNWKAVVDAINVLGGVDLEITDREFAYINGFITETAESTGTYSTHLEHAGMNHLDGVQAVAYSRLRLMDTDFNRTERQRKVVSLALEKAKQADLKTLQAVAGVVFPEISTSIGVEDVLSLAKNVKRYHLGQTAGFPFAKTTADIGRLDCVIPMTLSSNVVLLHQFLYDQEGFQPSATVRDISAKIGERSGIYDEGTPAGPDGDLTGAIGNTGGGSAPAGGNDGAGQQPAGDPVQPQPEAPQPPAAEEPTEAGTEEESSEEETTPPETTEEETTEETKRPAQPEPGPGGEPMLSDEQIQEGPGAGGPGADAPATEYTKPAEVPTEAVGPGFSDQP